MSDAPDQDSAAPVDPGPPEDLDRVAVPAHVRRAPRFARFIGTGVGAAIIAAMVLSLVLPNSTGVGRFLVFLVLALGLSLIGAIVGGLLATSLDRSGGVR